VNITNQIFADLYIGNDWADVIGLEGALERKPVPPQYLGEIDDIRAQCGEIERETASEEFSIRRSGVLLRVTCFANPDGLTTYILRQPQATIMPFEIVGFGESDMEFLLREDLRGLVLFSGDMRSGKTTAAASLVAARLKSHGGIAMAIEDPPETPLGGDHGRGRCIQVEVRGAAAYAGQVRKAMRSGAKQIYLGEIRDADSAGQVITSSNNGNFIISTTHALSVKDAIMRVCNLSGGTVADAEQVLASGLAAVIHMSLATRGVNTSAGKKPKKFLEYKMLRVEKQLQIQNIIREKSWHKIDNFLEDQVIRQRSGR
jgi:Tfp pilus assembly pilus retraction ATPase PilT